MPTDYTDVRLHCRCTGALPEAEVVALLGSWCGRVADGEDGLCWRCRTDCLGDGPTFGQCRVLSVDEVSERDKNWSNR